MLNNVLKLIFPNKSSDDFEDECEQVHQPIGDIVNPEGGFEVAGFCLNGNYRIFSRKTGQIVDLGPKQLDEATLFAHIGLTYCLEKFCVPDKKTGKKKFDIKKLTYSIRQGCDDFGPANDETIRGPGLYLDGQKLVVNYGSAVYDQFSEPVNTKPTSTRTYVAGPNLGFDKETLCASVSDVRLVQEVFESFGFEQSWGAAASLGWFASSVMGAVLPNSPSLILTAAKGAGKSTWVTFQAALMGPQAIVRDGVPTVPQVLHAVKEKSVTLICDEFEPLKRTKVQMENLAEIFNSGFTKNPGKGKFTRATGGVLRYFNPPTGVALCGINVPELDDALESRSVRLSMVPKNRSAHTKSSLLGTTDSNLAQELGTRLRRLLISRWQVIRDTRLVLHKMLQDVGHSDRFADTYSPLLAGYVALNHSSVPKQCDLQSLLVQWELDEVKPDEQESSSDACLNALLDRKIIVHVPQADAFVKTHVRLRDAIRIVVSLNGDKEGRRKVEYQLETLGVRPMLDSASGAWRMAVASSQHHVGVRQLFTGSAWVRGGWKDTLLRLPGSVKSQARLAGDSVKVVIVELPDSVANPTDDNLADCSDIGEKSLSSIKCAIGKWEN